MMNSQNQLNAQVTDTLKSMVFYYPTCFDTSVPSSGSLHTKYKTCLYIREYTRNNHLLQYSEAKLYVQGG